MGPNLEQLLTGDPAERVQILQVVGALERDGVSPEFIFDRVWSMISPGHWSDRKRDRLGIRLLDMVADCWGREPTLTEWMLALKVINRVMAAAVDLSVHNPDIARSSDGAQP